MVRGIAKFAGLIRGFTVGSVGRQVTDYREAVNQILEWGTLRIRVRHLSSFARSHWNGKVAVPGARRRVFYFGAGFFRVGLTNPEKTDRTPKIRTGRL